MRRHPSAAFVTGLDRSELDHSVLKTALGGRGHFGRYDDIEAALNATSGAYLKHLNDPVTAIHIAWLHTWRLKTHR